MTTDPFAVVSLGCHCFPRVCSAMLGLKKRRSEGEPSGPFDFGLFPMPMVRHMIESDFEGMTDPANLLVRPDVFGPPVFCDKRYPIGSYAHEMPPVTDIDFVGDNFRLFIERYNRRINNFRTVMQTKAQVLLFMCATNLVPPWYNPISYADFEAIYTTLQKRYPNTALRLVVIIERIQFKIPDSWDGRIYVINIPMIGPYTLYIPYIQFVLAWRNVFPTVIKSF